MRRIINEAPTMPGIEAGPSPLRRRVVIEEAAVEMDLFWAEQFHAVRILGIYDW